MLREKRPREDSSQVSATPYGNFAFATQRSVPPSPTGIQTPDGLIKCVSGIGFTTILYKLRIVARCPSELDYSMNP